MLTRVILIIGAVAAVIIGVQQWRISGLKHDNTTLTTNLNQANANLASRDLTIEALNSREIKTKQIEDDYEKLIQELQNEENGPVAPVLRRAIEFDLVR